MIVALNNKCHLTKNEFALYKEQLKNLQHEDTKIILFPSNIYLSNNIEGILIGSQNVSAYGKGSYTGEVSAEQLKALGVKYSLVGHSERRNLFCETSQDANRKITQLLDNDITPILCVGENEKTKVASDVIINDLKEAFTNITPENIKKIIIAYEPTWSIGTGIIPSDQEIKDIVNHIKEYYPNNLILYGGSVNDENIETLDKENVVDGYLIGALSLRLDKIKLLIIKIKLLFYLKTLALVNKYLYDIKNRKTI